MGFLGNLLPKNLFSGNLFGGDNDEILFFILVFLFLFNGNLFGKGSGCGDDDNSSVLFFIVLFLLLFFNNDNCDTKC